MIGPTLSVSMHPTNFIITHRLCALRGRRPTYPTGAAMRSNPTVIRYYDSAPRPLAHRHHICRHHIRLRRARRLRPPVVHLQARRHTDHHLIPLLHHQVAIGGIALIAVEPVKRTVHPTNTRAVRVHLLLRERMPQRIAPLGAAALDRHRNEAVQQVRRELLQEPAHRDQALPQVRRPDKGWQEAGRVRQL